MSCNISAREVLLTLSYSKKGDWDKIYSHIKDKIPLDENLKNEAFKNTHSNYVTIVDEDYPKALKQIHKPPFVLYYYGNLALLKSSCRLTAIGSRNPNLYQTDACYKLISEVEEVMDSNVVIISGMAKGLDSLMMKAAIDKNGPVVSILGSGIDNPYPKANKFIYDYCKDKNGLVLSEYPGSLPAKPDNFLFRNRLLAALAPSIFVGGGKQKSGTNNSVYWATTFNKNILALPCNQDFVYPELTNELIKQGATPILSTFDLKEEIVHTMRFEN